MWGGAKGRCGCGADGFAGGEANVSSGAVGIACINSDDLDFAATLFKMTRANDERSCLDTICGEQRGGAGKPVGDGYSEVGFTAGLESGGHGREAKAKGK